MLIPLVKSQLHPYANLWNNLVLCERFNFLKYNREICEYIFPQEEEKKWPPHIVFASSLYEEYELYSPSKKYILIPLELKKLKETYSAIYDLNISQIENISPNVRKYGKLCKDGHIISSKWISKNKIKGRNNYSVVINITVDKYAHFSNITPELIEKEIFGEVEYFIMHKHNELECIFAYVRKIDKYEEDNYGLIYFNKFGGFQFIEIIGIDRCVGFFKIENLYYILDRERI
ncbi:unnamed protein product [Rhizophagus irregularis]|nr:unnamed protein product [Rhizophagus irregularis]